ncbi:hypothetical protein Ccrd_008905 [Cynara cardunculus var. scolymus]|uniref:acetyl-CoA carboxytransferase n=1 Tax=Cynara cardunculus var. scolymus TaxID=59895 RepID=A0A118JT37_CYNCS|nr:hypothetical protein Ccrd_008905 [Cynara cardunculus var. scolymus]
MSTLPLTVGPCARQSGSVKHGTLLYFGCDFDTKYLRNNSSGSFIGVWIKNLKGYRSSNSKRFHVIARIKKGRKHDYPWPDDIPSSTTGAEALSYLSNFKPLAEKPKPVTLAFEKPLVSLEQKIIEIRRMVEETGLDFSDQISTLEKKYQQALKDLYTHLTPIQRLNLARHPNRPTVLDHILNMTEKWVELHGDRAGYDDPAMVTGIGSIDGKSYMFIGQQKGRNTKENIARNFAMPTPHGYRKALRMMKYADHHGLPIVTFIDTPGAFADLKSEELGQGEAIAFNLRTMFGLKVPIITVVTGEGGSGGALAIGCANKLFMLENAAFYVASPEACAAILWKSAQAAPKEPLGGAHADPKWTSQQIKQTIIQAMEELTKMDSDELIRHRMKKFRSMGLGGFQEGIPVDPERKRNMKPSEITPTNAMELESEIKNLKMKISESKGSSDPINIEKLKHELDEEITKACISMGLQQKIESLKMDMSKDPDPNESRLDEKAKYIIEEFKHNLSRPGAYLPLKQKLQKLSMIERLMEMKTKSEKLKTEINQKVSADIKEKFNVLKRARENLSKGEDLGRDLEEQVEKAKMELQEVLKSANLEIIGITNRKFEEKMVNVNKEIMDEIERSVNGSDVRKRIEELKEEAAKGSNAEKLEELRSKIKEEIFGMMNVAPLKEKVDHLVMNFGTENGRC